MDASELFIGRRSIRQFLLNEIFLAEPWSSRLCPIVAPRGFGKTELMGAVARDFEERRPENVFHIWESVEVGDTYASFWVRLLRKLTKAIDPEALAARHAKRSRVDDCACRAVWRVCEMLRRVKPEEIARESFLGNVARAIRQLFEAYAVLGGRIVITVDEFDRARATLPELYESFAHLVYGTHYERYNCVSVITLSRTRISDAREGASGQVRAAPIYLGGFTNAELGHYFASYRELPCGLPSRETQLRILYLCGRSPELLMRMRHNFSGMRDVNALDLQQMYDCDRRYFEYVCYNQLFSMRLFYADEWQLETLADLFFKHFIRPNAESLENAPRELELLREHGFVTREAAEGNLYELLGLPIPPSVAHTRTDLIYEPLTPYMRDFIAREIETT